MKATQIAPFGGPADAVFHRDRIVAAWQSGRDRDVRLVVAEIDPVSHAILLSYSIALGDDVGAFPRLLSAHDSVWLIYRNGASLGGRAILRRDGQEVWRSPVACGGNDPVCLGLDEDGVPHFAWQRYGDNAIAIAGCELPAVQMPDGYGRGTGLSHLLRDGLTPVLVDDARGSVPGITRPSWAGDLVAGEHPDSGVRVLAGDGRELRIWPGEETVTPRLAFDPATGMHAVVTSGVRNGIDYGVRLATFTASELQAHVPVDPDAPFPPGKGWTRRDDIAEIGVEAFALGPVQWARTGVPAGVTDNGTSVYSHQMQGRRMGLAVQHTKGLGDGPRSAIWTVDVPGYIGLAFDQTNEIGGGYRLVNPGTTDTARLYAGRMRVGAEHRRDVPVEILNVATGSRRAVTWRGWVEAVYDGPAIGDVPAGRYALIGWTFDIAGDGADGDPNGVVELTLCHETAGPVAWRETHRRTGAVRTWYGVRNVARIPDPEPRFADALPTSPPVVIPDPDPEDDMKIWQYNDADAVRVIDFLELKYLTPVEQCGLGRTEVDKLGIARWNHDAIRLLDGGRSVDATLKEINRRINQIVGLPLDAWPSVATEPVPDQPVPSSSRLVGPLRIAADRSTFIDDSGPVLPVFCHAGDFLSRWVRDPNAVRAELDAVAAVGRYHGVRTWTVLGGSSYWAGREVGPMYQGDAFWSAVAEFTAALSQRGLRWLVSQGDMLRIIPGNSGRAAFMTRLAQTIASVDPLVVSGQAPSSRTLAEIAAPVIRRTLDAGNEAWQNGEVDPAAMRQAVDAFRAVLNVGIWSTTSPPNEEKSDLDRYAGSVFDVHGYRDAHYYDKVRHIFSVGYEVKPSTRLGIQSEPFGPGSRVSASQNKGEITDGVIALATGVSLMARQMWVYFSGPGVISDEGERLVDMPGFKVCAQVRDWLPRDVMAFGSLVHGGESQAARVFAVPAKDETRCDHAISADGRFVAALYGPRWRECRQVRNADVLSEFSCGGAGKLVQGRLR